MIKSFIQIIKAVRHKNSNESFRMCLSSVTPSRDQYLQNTGLFSIPICELYHRGENKNWFSDVKYSVEEASHQISRISFMKGSETLMKQHAFLLVRFSRNIVFPLCD